MEKLSITKLLWSVINNFDKITDLDLANRVLAIIDQTSITSFKPIFDLAEQFQKTHGKYPDYAYLVTMSGLDIINIQDKPFSLDLVDQFYSMCITDYATFNAISALHDGDHSKAISFLESQNNAAVQVVAPVTMDQVCDLYDDFSSNITGIVTGVPEIDEIVRVLGNGTLTVIAGGPGDGKMESLDNKLVTPNGLVRMGDIKLGQDICGSDGKVYQVTGIFPKGKQESYRVHFSDNTHVDCGLDHLWEVSTINTRKHKKLPKVLSTRDLITQGVKIKDRSNFSVRYSKPVHFNPQEIPDLDPYLLGVFLGDGTSRIGNISITNSEIDIQESIISKLSENDYISINSSNDMRVCNKNRSTSTLKLSLKSLGLLGLYSHEKFIPKNYLYNSLEIRLSVLQGLLDTDGYVVHDNSSSIEYTTTSKLLCLDVVELVRSLGGRANYTKKQGSYTKNGIKIITKEVYRLFISLPSEIIPVRSKKHLAKYNAYKRLNSKYITKIEFVGYELMQCISVSSPDSLYITEGYTLTHNTTYGNSIYYTNVVSGKNMILFNFEITGRDNLFSLASREALELGLELSAGTLKKGVATDQEKEYLKKARDSFINKEGKGNYVILTPENLRSVTPQEIVRVIKEYITKWGRVDGFVWDYLQLMKFYQIPGVKDEKERMNFWTRFLQTICVSLDIAGVLLSQMSREGRKRFVKTGEGSLSYLSEANELERSASVVLELYSTESNRLGSTINISLCKHRNGSTNIPVINVYCNFAQFKVGSSDFSTMFTLDNFAGVQSDSKNMTDFLFD